MPQIIEVPGQGQIEFPDGMSDADIVSAIRKISAHQQPAPQQNGFMQGVGNLAAGALRGASNIGATILNPLDSEARAQRKATIEQQLQEWGAQPESALYKTGEIGTEIAGTAGVGGALAAPLKVGKVAPRLAEALRTGGFNLGGAPAATAGQMAANAATRLGAGAAVGGASAGLVDPESMGTGAALGMAFPVAAKAAFGAGSAAKAALYDPLMNKDKLMASALMRAVGRENAPDVVNALRRTAKTPGVSFSAGESSGNEALAAMEDAIRSGNAGGALSAQSSQNRKSLADALRNIAQDDVARTAAVEARETATRPLYEGMQEQVFTGSDDMAKLLRRAQSGGALSEAKKIAGISGREFSIPVVDEAQAAGFRSADEFERAMYGGMPDTGKIVKGAVPVDMPEVGNSRILAEIRKLGGLSTKDMADLVGERATNKAGAQVGVFTKKGEEVGDMVRRLVDRGVMPREVLNDVDGGAQSLRDAIQRQLAGGGDDMAMRALAESYYGAPQELKLARDALMKSAAPQEPMQQIVGQAIKGRDLQAVKKGLDQSISDAKGVKKTELLALKQDYLDWMGTQSPDYLQANKVFSEMSRPINQMDVGKFLSEKLIPSTAEEIPSALNAATLAKALRNPNAAAQTATGFRGSKMAGVLEPEQLKTVYGVNSDASRIAETLRKGAGYGSPTARRLATGEYIGANFAEKAPLLSKLFEGIGQVPGINYATKGGAAIGGMIGNGINNSIKMRLDDMLARDPAGVSAMLQKELSSLPAGERAKVLGFIPKGAFTSGMAVMAAQ